MSQRNKKKKKKETLNIKTKTKKEACVSHTPSSPAGDVKKSKVSTRFAPVFFREFWKKKKNEHNTSQGSLLKKRTHPVAGE